MLATEGWLGLRAARDADQVAALNALSSSETFVETQLVQGPTAAARSALIRRLSLLDALGPKSRLQSDILDLDRMLVLLRLWKVERALGEQEQGDEFNMQARRLCENAKWKDCSDSAFERTIDARVSRQPQK